MRTWRRRPVVSWVTVFSLCLAASGARADGLLGVFFDTNGQSCAGNVPPASYAILYVVLQPEGSTYSGITGVEFRIDTSGASGYMFANESVISDGIKVGNALSGGCNIAFSNCQSGGAIAVMSFQVLNGGTGNTDGAVRVAARQQPTNPNFACQLAVLCDAPEFTKVCVDAGFALLNPSGSRSCAGGRLPAEWSTVKELYRP